MCPGRARAPPPRPVGFLQEATAREGLEGWGLNRTFCFSKHFTRVRGRKRAQLRVEETDTKNLNDCSE